MPMRPPGSALSLFASFALVAALAGQAPVEAAAGAVDLVVAAVAPPLPRAITSFGACAAGGWVYVFGGHVGREHAHSRDNVVGDFQRLDLATGAWQSLPDGPSLQGTALVAGPDGAIWRLGGMTARNAAGDDGDLHSTASVARFEPRTQRWVEATPLPEPRSSHDAAVIGDHVYVVGGWTLAGAGDGEWLTTAWRADLRAAALEWQPVAGPGERRAAALAALGDRLVLLGGMQPGGLTATVRVFDVAAQRWSDGPPLPGNAFGTAALACGERLIATVADGRVLAWDGGADWQRIATLATPRFFHRLVATSCNGELLALGGAGRGGHTRTVEFVATAPTPMPTLRTWTLPAPGQVRSRQALLLLDNRLWAFGGNRGTSGDRFAAEQFADDVWRIDLLAQTADRVAALPTGRQSMATAVFGDRAQNVVLGGLGVGDDSVVGSLAAAFRWDPQAQALRPFASLPRRASQCAVVHHGGKLWVLGGTDFRPDGDGGTETVATDVLCCDPAAAEPAFAPCGLSLPRPRRSFGAAVVGDELLLVGGLGGDFESAGPMDVLDFATNAWRAIELPVPWVSPQVAVIGDRLYVACGGTMNGQRFTEDRSLWSWNRAEGWRRVVAALPFAVRHVQMRALRDRLLFYAVDGDRIVLRTLLPDPAADVRESAMHR
jgi:hypothetical protein